MVRVTQRRLRGTGNLYLWAAAIIIGTFSGYCAVGFSRAIHELQRFAYGAGDYTLTIAGALDWWILLGVPVCSGLVVGVLLQLFIANGRAKGVADVIVARDLHGARVPFREGVVSSAVHVISLGGGASTGREGPMVHLAATLSSVFCRFFHLGQDNSRTLLGCAVAAGVSALFNAPIAGMLFALEVVLGRYSIRTFAPIVVASVSGTVVGRTYLGEFPAILVSQSDMDSLFYLPAFAVLGLVAAMVAVALVRSILIAQTAGDRIQESLRLPLFLRPALAGLLLGCLGYLVPEVIGVGYATTTRALSGSFFLDAALIILVVKIIAVAISLGGCFGGGVFSPSLMIGALLGAIFGLLMATVSADQGLPIGPFALAGMAAVSATVLGAPISTTLIVFELTADYRTTLAVMVAVSVAVIVAQRFIRRSFFYEQLERVGVPLAGGRHRYLLGHCTAREVMQRRKDLDPVRAKEAVAVAAAGFRVIEEDSLRDVIETLREGQRAWVPVVDEQSGLVGIVLASEALGVYAGTLEHVYDEEHD